MANVDVKKAKAAPEPRKVGGYSRKAKISLGADKEGKPYGKTNNPKRSGSSAAKVFEVYRSGMTIQAAIDAGIPTANILWDKDKGFITIAEAA